MFFDNQKEALEKATQFFSHSIQYIQNNRNLIKILCVIFAIIIALLFFTREDDGEIIVENSNSNVAEDNAPNNDSENNTVGESQQLDLQNETLGYVDVGGEVNNPGVYPISDGDRVFSLIEKAGGLTLSADISAVNQASRVEDGQKLYIPAKDEFTNESTTEDNETTNNSRLININFANQNNLEEIPGVGPSTAKSIIQYREENGHFKKIEDIMNVSGIGEKTFENMKDYITV